MSQKESAAAKILRRCWGDPAQMAADGEAPFRGLDVEIDEAIDEAIEQERRACVEIIHKYNCDHPDNVKAMVDAILARGNP